MLWINYITGACFLFIIASQVNNYIKYRNRNSADAQRLAMLAGTLAALGCCVGCLMKSFEVVTFSLAIMPFSGFVIYVLGRR